MKQHLKFVEEYKPTDGEYSPFPRNEKSESGKHISEKRVEIQFFPGEGRRYTYMSVSLFQIENWSEDINEYVEFKEQVRKLFSDDFYAWNPEDLRLSMAEQHLIVGLASGNFLGYQACSAVHSLLLKVISLDKEMWRLHIPGEIAFRENLKQL